MKISIYKLLSVVLVALLVVGGVFYGIERHANAKQRRELTNQIADLEGMVQEAETLYSHRSVEVKNLKLKNEELNKIIKDRNEEAVALTEAVLKWKNKYIKVTKVSQSLSYTDPKRVEELAKELIQCEANSNADLDLISACEKLWEYVRARVEFDETQDPLRVYGFTLTNPPEAEINIEWIRDIKLSLVLTKDKNDLFRVYLDTNSPDLVPAELKLSVDPGILDRKWYEKIGVDGSVTVGQGVASSLGLRYDIFDSWSLGPSIILHYDGEKLRKTYGVSTTWYPFR